MTIVYFDYIVPATVLIPIAVLIPKLGKSPAYIKWLFFYLVISAITNVISIITARYDIPNLWLTHIYTSLESFILLCFFRLIIKKTTIRNVITVLIILFPLFCILNFLFLQSFYDFNTYTRPVEALIFVALSMIYWGQESEDDIRWSDVPADWFVISLFLYFSGAFFIFLFSNYLAGYVSTKVMDIAWYTHATLIGLMYILIAIGFLKWEKQ